MEVEENRSIYQKHKRERQTRKLPLFLQFVFGDLELGLGLGFEKSWKLRHQQQHQYQHRHQYRHRHRHHRRSRVKRSRHWGSRNSRRWTSWSPGRLVTHSSSRSLAPTLYWLRAALFRSISVTLESRNASSEMRLLPSSSPPAMNKVALILFWKCKKGRCFAYYVHHFLE